MPTRDRLTWVTQALRCYRRQSYPHREMVIVDTGEHPVPDDVRGGGVRIVRPEGRLTVGAARMLGVRAARGDLVAHWDDDDWVGPDRLARQVDALTTSGAAVCGQRELLCYRPLTGEAWTYAPLAGDLPFLAGGTLMYDRAYALRNPLPPFDVGEDAAFVAGCDPADVVALADGGWYVAVLHDANTAPKNLADPRWTAASLDEVGRRLGRDRTFYAMLRRGRTSARPAHSANEETVTVVGDLRVYDGLASMTEYAALGLDRAGVDVRLQPLTLDRRGLAPRTRRLLDRPPADGPVLYWTSPRPELAMLRDREVVVRLAWESSRLPESWVRELEPVRALVVPSTFVADACRASGVTAPVEVVPDGVDPAVYHWRPRPEREGLTTLVVGTLIARKHVAAAVAAWQRAFAGDPDARLVVKARFRVGRLELPDTRIEIIDTDETTRGIADWYARADVLLALGNEGFGLPLLEGMATGLPVVALDSEGQHDICGQVPDLVLAVPPAAYAPYVDSVHGPCGVAAVPDVDRTAAQLRWVATHRREAVELGREAARWALRERSVEAMAAQVLDAMERHVAPPRPLRRRRTLWVPTWTRRCGISEYTGHLLGGLRRTPPVAVAAQPPDRRALSLLHVQHEDGLFDDTTLLSYLDTVDVPVVVTEHSVGQLPRAWEERADALVALTDAGARTLAARAHGRRVVRLPHGCPAWFPPRKRERGRVLGCFGFVEPYKGLPAVLDVLRRLPGTQLVVHGTARSPEAATRFAADCAGLPVRWCRDYQSSAEAARRLAAECDALVFWYDEVPHASASGAVRVGLATGVPVLTSPTSWFADLRDVTYQPADLVAGVERLLDDTVLRRRLTAAARDHCATHGWRRVAAEHLALWESLETA